MHKRIIILFILLLINGCGQTTKNTVDWNEKYPDDLNWIIKNVKDRYDLSLYIQQRIKYQIDNNISDYSEPQEVWARRYGDCDDYARLWEYILERQGITAECVEFNNNHVVCVTAEGHSNNGGWTTGKDISYLGTITGRKNFYGSAL